MSNSYPINTMMAKRMLPILRNKLPMVTTVNKDFQDEISDQQRKQGGIININKPPRYVGRTGELMVVENTTITQVPMTLTQFGVDVSFSQTQLQLSLDAVAAGMADDVLDAAASTIAAKIESDGTLLYKQVANVVGTPGTPPTAASIIATGGAYITANGGSTSGDRTLVLDSFANASLATSVAGYFNPMGVVNKAYANGRLGSGYGFEIYDDPAVQSFTAGTYGGTPLTNAATAQTGASLITDGWTATTTILNVGDTFTIDGVFSVNPQTRQSTGKLQNFVVTAVTTTDGSGNSTIAISPSIVASGAFQNVTNGAANNKAITITSGASTAVSRQSLGYDKNAFTFACVPMALPPKQGVIDATVVKDKMSGLSISMIEFYDGKSNQRMTRFDVLYAWAATYPELAFRLQG